LNPLWHLAFLALLVLGALTAWHKRGKLASIPVFMCVAALAWFAVHDAMGRAKPAELSDLPEGTQILGVAMEEGESIEMLVQRPGEAGARALELPWSNDLAEQLQGAQRAAEELGEGMGVGPMIDSSGVAVEGEQVIRANPQPARPPKTP